jgi:hypothetical protein
MEAEIMKLEKRAALTRRLAAAKRTAADAQAEYDHAADDRSAPSPSAAGGGGGGGGGGGAAPAHSTTTPNAAAGQVFSEGSTTTKKKAKYTELARSAMTAPLARRFTIDASRELVSYERVSWDEDGVVSVQYTAHGEMEELGDIENVAKAMSDAVMARDNPIEAICLLRSVLRDMRAGAVDFSVTNEIVGTIASKPPHDNPIPHRRVSSRRAARARVYSSSCRRWSVTR